MAAEEPNEPAAERLRSLLGYVEQVVRLDERPALRLADYRLATGQAFVVHQHELHALPGVRHDLVDEDGPVWLSVERLRRGEPPAPPEPLAEWIELSPDPDRLPHLREHLIRTVTVAEKDALLASGDARAEDCAEALDRNGGLQGHWDVRLRLEDRPEVRTAVEAYLAEIWVPWAEAERPVRRSLALYQKLFEVAQLAEMGGGDQSFELVWGVGLARWQQDQREIDLPLIERLVEIEIDEAAGAVIRVRPRAVAATVNLRPYEELGIDGVALALDGSRRALASVDSDEGLSPYRREGFEPVLRVCQARLDAQGIYLPDQQALAPDHAPPAASERLTVSDRWVLFGRRRSDNFILADLEKLRNSIERAAAEGILPGPAKTLVTGPSDQGSPDVWTPLTGRIGEAGADPVGPAAAEEPSGDLFFPKPFNDDQIEIVRRLESADGIVVQGPPGTGKTHTISNIICHYMATGRRVLVVSHGEPALAVLRDQLPESVRDLAISITATEREGFRQLETAVRMLQSIVEGLKPGEQTKLIRDLEASIVGMRSRLAEIDQDIEHCAVLQLAPAATGENPAELARRVAGLRERHAWFVDRPERTAAELEISDEDIRALRDARIGLGADLEHLDAVLPSVEDLPDGEAIARFHDDLVRAEQFSAAAGKDPSLTIRIGSPSAIAQGLRAGEALTTLQQIRARSQQQPWLEDLLEQAIMTGRGSRILDLLRAFVADVRPVLEERDRYLRLPVELPDGFVHSTDILVIIRRLAAGEQVFGFFAFKERALRPVVEAIRIGGRSPEDTEHWAHILDHLDWRERLGALDVRWRTLADEIGAPVPDSASARELGQVAESLEAVLFDAPAAMDVLEGTLPHLVFGGASPRQLWQDPVRLHAVGETLRNAVASAQLAAAKAEVARISALLTEDAGRIGSLGRNILAEAVGRADIAIDQVAHLWDALRGEIDDLARQRPRFETVRSLTARIAAAGAPEWAARLAAEPALEDSDPLIPADWREAWDWAAAASYLQRIDDRERLSKLADERVRVEAELRRTFERLVRERTFYELGRSMTGRVRSALMMFATALRRTGKGTGKGAARHRRDARTAMSQCYDAIPCWIMPSWRVAEQLPGEVGSFDLVIMDEASQSDIRELPSLLRGKKILVVGDDKQVSPTAAFIENAKIDRLEHGFLKGQPFKTLLLPGSSLYDLAKVMFPDKLVMLKEHFRCVEQIIRFSMQFYPEPLVPLRVPAARERLDPPLIDIYVPDGRRQGDKINPREAEVIVEEIRSIVEDPALARNDALDRWRTIGVVSLIGAKQAALINRMLLDEIGEEVMLRHRIACGDSATFQGNERDIVFLSMVADPTVKQAQTAAQFEQRFNVALSRARDRLVLVRSVREEELNPNDLKARVIRHFREPMAGAAVPAGDLEAMCESDFERDVLRRLLERGYHVTPQVGAQGYRIDLVVEGSNGRRLAVECDGDKYHGPERWADDMRRQRVLERVGWRFWRCWASSFTLDPDGCMADLFATLARAGIEPSGGAPARNVYTLHKTLSKAPAPNPPGGDGVADSNASDAAEEEIRPGLRRAVNGATSPDGIRVGDRVVVRYLDDNKTVSFTLSDKRDDVTNGFLASTSPLGSKLLGLSEDDEVEFEAESQIRRVLVIRTERGAAVH